MVSTTLGVKSARTSESLGIKQHRASHTMGRKTHMVFNNMNSRATPNGRESAVEEHRTMSVNEPKGLMHGSTVTGKKSSLERKKRH